MISPCILIMLRGLKMAHYCDSAELEEWWAGWLATAIYTREKYEDKSGKKRERINFTQFGDERNWEKMSEMLYSICCGITKKFSPKTDEEFYNLANEAMTKLLVKIQTGKLKFTPTCLGGSPVFNLVTTTVQRILYSYMNQQTTRRKRHAKFVVKTVQEKAPELLASVRPLYEY